MREKSSEACQERHVENLRYMLLSLMEGRNVNWFVQSVMEVGS